MYTKPFSALSKKDADIAGGKGASLGEMINAGIPVPDGFVVLSTTFDEFIQKAGLTPEIDAILDSVDHRAVHSMDAASEKIQELIKRADMPADIAMEIDAQFGLLGAEFVAVRSSATAEDGADHAWAGQLDSYLNTPKDHVLEKVQECWASLFTPRAIFYRFEKGLDTTKISVAVVVQKMVNSEKSGIAFSVHPVTEDRNQLIIEAGFGLGEAIVSGSVTPDSYVVSKVPREIIDTAVSSQGRALYRKSGGGNEWRDIPEEGKAQVLDQDGVLELSTIIMTIENHYGFPCDIEWAYEAGKFYIVQSRPITTLSPVSGVARINLEKAYTRDTTLIIQQGWHDVVASAFEKERGIKNPNVPPVIHNMKDGVIEIWENEASTQWFMDILQQEIAKGPSFITSVLDRYEQDLSGIKELWSKGPISDKETFIAYVDKVFGVMSGFVFMYYTGVDERTPHEIRERALQMRETDTYFDSNDKLMRQSLLAIYPELKGVESGVLRSELRSLPSREVLEQRKKNFVMVGENEAFLGTLREYQAVHPELHFHIEIPPADSSTLIGQVGNKGYAKGTIRILKRKEQIGEAFEGDIIVSTMTTPDFIPAMQKAAAIITDEGGITCHAAIVARELGKPCVIGTKFATEILHDGDEVEVDADNGIVRILSKKNNKHVFERIYVREVTMMTLQVWYRAENERFLELISYSHPEEYLFFEVTRGVAKSYFDSDKAVMKIHDAIIQSVTGSDTYFDEIEKKFYFYSDILKEFISGAKKIHDRESLSVFYTSMLEWWAFYSVVYWISYFESDRLSKNVHERSKTMRLYLETIMEDSNRVYSEGLKSILADSYKEVHNYATFEEVMNDAVPADSELERRAQHFMFGKGISFESLDEFLARNNWEIERPREEDKKSLKGSSGYKGKVTGIVKVCETSRDMGKVNEGDILVSSMTTPDFMPALRKAAAIVTDEGGITCHAAIVARELGKPCVIGTHFATDVLNDGDEVEVDADNGTVTILRKQEAGKSLVDSFLSLVDKSDVYPFNASLSPLLTLMPWSDSSLDMGRGTSFPVILINGKEKSYIAISEGSYKKPAKEILRSHMAGDVSIDQLKAGYESLYAEVSENYGRIISKDLSGMSETALVKEMKDAVDGLSGIIARTLFIETLDREMAMEVLGDGSLLEKVWEEGTHPHFESFERRRLQAIKDAWSTSKSEEQKVDELMYIYTDYYKPKSKNTARIQIESALATGLPENESSAAFVEWKKILNDTERRLVDYVQYVMEARDVRKDPIAKAQYVMYILAEELAKRAGLAEEFVVHLAACEYLNGIEWIASHKSDIETRSRGQVFLMHPDGILEVEQADYQKTVDAFLAKTSSRSDSENILKGQTASGGKVTARVRVVLDIKHDTDFNEGDVLVTSMTRPEFVPIMKKASAVITNEGGITCHAAIISRELKIPCVIGTKVATSVLKDGDLVEVDATNGVVTVIR